MSFQNKDIFDDLLASVGPILQQLGQQLLVSALGSLLGKRDLASLSAYLPYLQQFQSLFNGSVASTLQNVQGIFTQYQSQIQSFLGSLTSPQARSTLLLASQQAKGDIADAFNSLLNEAMGHLTSIATSLANVGLASILGALSGKRGIWDDLTSALSGITSTLSGHVDNITSSLVSVGSSLLGSVTPHLQDLQDQLTNHALNAAQSLLGTLSGISGSLSG
jgi:phage-related protein